MLFQIVRQESGEFLLTVYIEVIQIIEILLLIQTRLCIVLLKVQIIKAVFLHDIADGVAPLKAGEGTLDDDMRKTSKDDVFQSFTAAVFQKIAQSLFLDLCQRLRASDRSRSSCDI